MALAFRLNCILSVCPSMHASFCDGFHNIWFALMHFQQTVASSASWDKLMRFWSQWVKRKDHIMTKDAKKVCGCMQN